MTVCRDEEVLIDARMVQVMGDGCKDCTHRLNGCQKRSDFFLIQETVHGLSHVRCMHAVVVRIRVVITLFKQACGNKSAEHRVTQLILFDGSIGW